MRFSSVATTALAAACLIFAARAVPAEAKCQLQQITELPVIGEGARPLVEVSVNGRPARFLVDTGSFATLLTPAGAKALGLEVVAAGAPGVTVYGVGGSTGAGTARIKDFKIGLMGARDIDLIVTGRVMQSDRYVGVLGRDALLSRNDLELDLANHVIRLLKPKDCHGDDVVYWNKPYSLASIEARSDAILVDASLNGKRISAELDSGASRSVVTLDAARAAGVTPRSAGVASAGTSTGLGGVVQTWVGTFESLGVGGETVHNAVLELADLFSKDREVATNSHIPTAAVEQPDMLLGADFVKAHRIYIAVSQGKVYFTYNGGRIFEAPGEGAPAAKASQ